MAEFEKALSKINKAIRYIEQEAPIIMGTEAVNHYKESFENQGFTDQSIEKWDEVERRKPSSPWRGFQYGSTAAHPKRLKRKSSSVTNYSPAAEKRPILSGQTQELMHSIKWERNGNGVRVYSDTPYSKVQNEGGPIKIFGKASRTLKQRKFMGQSQQLRDKIRMIIINDLKQIFK